MHMVGDSNRFPKNVFPGRDGNIIFALGMILLAVVCVAYVGVKLEWTLAEGARFVGGIVLLWAPVTFLCFVVLEDQVRETDVRFCLSLGASYSLTVVSYFAFSVLGVLEGFYVLQAVAVVAAFLLLWRRSRQVNLLAQIRQGFRPDWFLILIVAASLVVNIYYQVPLTVRPDSGDISLNVYLDHLYHTGLDYELARHVPPLQASVAGELPERAYHMFSHLVTVLIDRFTSQNDMLRAHLVYHYIIIEILLCLIPYALGRVLTGSKVGGYISALMMYLLAYACPAILPNSINYFYFTLFPHMTSGLQPALMTSPQMYASFVVLYATLLGMALVARRYSERLSHHKLLFLTALIVVVGLRFRVQMFIAVAPAFLLLVIFMGLRSGLQLNVIIDLRKSLLLLKGRMRVRRMRPFYFFIVLLTLFLSWLLYKEMSLPVYLQDTAIVGFGYNGLTADPNSFFNSWPFAPGVLAWVNQSFTDQNTRLWVWQVISLIGFTLLNIVGVPLLLSTICVYLRKTFNRSLGLYSWFTLLCVVITIIGSMVIVTGYDNYSVGGQMTFEARWYLFPFAAVVLYIPVRWVQKHLAWPSATWMVLVILCVINVQQLTNDNPYREIWSVLQGGTLMKGEYEALIYIREHTPSNAVIMTREDLFSGFLVYAVSGISGRAAYLEKSYFTDVLLSTSHQDRAGTLRTLWSTTDSQEFCQTLQATPATFVIIGRDTLPPVLDRQSCVHPIWVSSDQNYTIWQVQRD